MRKLFIGIFAAVTAIFLTATPALAASDSTAWSPVPVEEKIGSYYLDDAVPQDARNTIESALELAEIPSDASRLLYVAKLPEGTNVQTAAREVAKTWSLNKDEQSLVLYDVTSGGTFVWPATEDNVTLAASLSGNTSVDQFSTQVPTIFDGVSTSDSGGSSPFIIILFVFLGFIFFITLVTFIF